MRLGFVEFLTIITDLSVYTGAVAIQQELSLWSCSFLINFLLFSYQILIFRRYAAARIGVQ